MNGHTPTPERITTQEAARRLGAGEEAGVSTWQHAWISVDPYVRADLTTLTEMGEAGWELVSVLSWSPSVFTMFFRRPKPPVEAVADVVPQ
jgi:hypothetical protein